MSRSTEFAESLRRAGETPPESPPPPERILEVLLFAGGQPLTCELAAGIIRGLTPEQFESAITALNRHYRLQNRPYVLRPSAEGWTMESAPGFRAVRERLTGGPREARLNGPTIDVLSLVAYQQPITRAAIDSMRGSDSASILRQLVRLGLITMRGAANDEPTYTTTPRFLELFGLRSLDDLPRTVDLQQI